MDQTVRTDLPTRGYEGFGGVVSEMRSESRPWWPAPRRARPGAPNVVVVLVDDMGFSDISPFGGEIDTPHIQSLADEGYRLTNFHSTPLCAPSRAALMTGLNPHRAGFASVPHVDPGFPGYNMELPNDVPTLAESFRSGGYATFMVGKWHLTKEAHMHDGADKSSWPVQRGFDRYFGSLDGFTALYHPHRLVSDNSPVFTADWPDDRYLTDVLTDRALEMINGLRANDPAKPFFLYFAHHAVHGPVQAKAEDIAKYRGMYDAGWDATRLARFRRQIDTGLFPDDTQLSASGPRETQGVLPWDSLDDARKELFARHMEVYAAAVDGIDQSVGRLVEHLKRIGEYDNTIFVITSDNGATAEGGVEGTRSYFSQFVYTAGLPDDWVRDVPRPLELLGGPQVHGHYPKGWAHVSNTPFRLYKSQAYAGGIHVPFVLSWPDGLPRDSDDAGVRRQYTYVTDLAPTLLTLAGVERPTATHGRPVQEVDGVPFDHLLRDPAQRTSHLTQYVECGGQRGYFEDGLKIVAPHMPGRPFTDESWELYDIDADPAETENLAPARPGTVADMAEKWRRAAWFNTVFPLDDTGRMRRVRPSSESILSEPVTIYPGTPVLERFRSSKLTLLRSFTVEASLDFAAGDEGVIFAHGDQGGGYVLFVEDGELRFTFNAYGDVVRAAAQDPLDPGRIMVTVDFEALEEMRWRITASLGRRQVLGIASVPQLLSMSPFTGISVGVDAGGPVDWDLHLRRGAFHYRRGLDWVRYTPGEPADYNPEIIVAIEEVAARKLE
ncbi:MAG TPA: arylsulfatase [Streptomyces sp.]|uniref:arylsulfatase n=1 Tax=Streptomyces sp. TaxID=1931 RepID=UPI002CE243B6|nr:arylsulfatase [Streptomyces sp.]HWU11427.1 arylsulfatase [Streptomyces sp.]